VGGTCCCLAYSGVCGLSAILRKTYLPSACWRLPLLNGAVLPLRALARLSATMAAAFAGHGLAHREFARSDNDSSAFGYIAPFFLMNFSKRAATKLRLALSCPLPYLLSMDYLTTGALPAGALRRTRMHGWRHGYSGAGRRHGGWRGISLLLAWAFWLIARRRRVRSEGWRKTAWACLRESAHACSVVLPSRAGTLTISASRYLHRTCVVLPGGAGILGGFHIFRRPRWRAIALGRRALLPSHL